MDEEDLGPMALESEAISQNEIIRKNISAITEDQKREEVARTLSTRISDAITAFTGSMLFVAPRFSCHKCSYSLR